MLSELFPPEQVTIVSGDGSAFSSLPFDHLVFTGSTEVGRAVMKAASENLGGQTCIAPDYALVHESEIDTFIASYDRLVKTAWSATSLRYGMRSYFREISAGQVLEHGERSLVLRRQIGDNRGIQLRASDRGSPAATLQRHLELGPLRGP